jgi:signal peptidase II
MKKGYCKRMYCSLTRRRSQASIQLLYVGFFIFLLDQLTKWLVYAYVPMVDAFPYTYPYGGIGVFQNWSGIEFSINQMTNKGAAWGVLGAYQMPLILIRMGLITALVIYLFYFNLYKSWEIPLLFIIAGALGNVMDYFIYGHVIDMFHFVLWGYDFPIFNIADSAITIGVFALFILSWRKNPT